MKTLIASILENRSTRELFMFRALCGVCGASYGNRVMRFSKAGMEPAAESRRIIIEALYEQELHSARQTAIREAAENLNYCPICRRLVCNRCFLICEDLDLCAECADRLNVPGSPVLSDTIMDAV